jgi:hypothetical protein
MPMVTFSCGHKGYLEYYSFMKSAEKRSRVEWAEKEGLCPECFAAKAKEEREAKYAAAASAAQKQSDEYGLPNLTGTEKQINYANTLRNEIWADVLKAKEGHAQRMEKFREELSAEDYEKTEEMWAESIWTLDYVFQNFTDGHYWIEKFKGFVGGPIRKMQEIVEENRHLYHKSDLDKEIEVTLKKEAEEEKIVKPEGAKYPGIVKIKEKDREITVEYPKSEELYNIVKALGYKWDNCRWRKNVLSYDNIADRMAEIGSRLLNVGYIVSIPDAAAREKAVAGEYEAESNRWITGTKDENIAIDIPREGNLYEKARKIKGAHWVRGEQHFEVSPKMYAEIEDFAEMFGYKISARAATLLQAARVKIENIEKRKIAAVKTEIKRDGLKEILLADNGILPDLVD